MGTTKRILLGFALAGALACGKKTPSGPSQLKLKDASAALSSAGFKTDGLKDTDAMKFSAQKCVAGTLEGIDAVLCEYGNVDAIGAGRGAGEDWVAQATTGAVLVNGYTLLAVADRSKADPNGKTIQKLTQAFQHAQ